MDTSEPDTTAVTSVPAPIAIERAAADAVPTGDGPFQRPLARRSAQLGTYSAVMTMSYLAARTGSEGGDAALPPSSRSVQQAQDLGLALNLGMVLGSSAGVALGALDVGRLDRFHFAHPFEVAPHDGRAMFGAGVGLLLSGASFGVSTGPQFMLRPSVGGLATWAGITGAYLLGGSLASSLGATRLSRGHALVRSRYAFSVERGPALGIFAFGLEARRK